MCDQSLLQKSDDGLRPLDHCIGIGLVGHRARIDDAQFGFARRSVACRYKANALQRLAHSLSVVLVGLTAERLVVNPQREVLCSGFCENP